MCNARDRFQPALHVDPGIVCTSPLLPPRYDLSPPLPPLHFLSSTASNFSHPNSSPLLSTHFFDPPFHPPRAPQTLGEGRQTIDFTGENHQSESERASNQEAAAAMRPSFLLLLVVFAGVLAGGARAGPPVVGEKLSPEYYAQTCPRAERIIAEVVQSKQMANPTTAAGVLRLFFHDCFVSGCDASVLVAATAFEKSEQSAEINHSLPGDAFDAVVRAKLALELECPEVVSCADILALAARVLVTMTGGPRYPIALGRKDSLTSSPTAPDKEIPQANVTMDHLIKVFQDKGFTVQEMVALSGGHTLGFSHCKEFAQRIFDYKGKPGSVDPTMNPVLSKGLQTACKDYLKDPTIAAFNDVMTPGKFDNMYFVNLERGLGLLATDEEMWSDLRTKPFVKLYASNPTAFFDDFSRAIDKLSLYGVKTGAAGEVRRRCDAYNHGPMPK